MKRVKLIIILAVAALALTGCRHSHYIENHAYAVLMGIDRIESGGWEVSVRIPGIGSGGGGGSGGSGQEKGGGSQGESEYLKFSAMGASFQDALTVLGAGVPRDLDLSSLSVIVISEDIAASAEMPQLLEILTDERKIYGATRIAVCEGKAVDFINQQEPVIGNVLSEGLISRLENLEEIGYIPASQLDTVSFATRSVYSDPLIMLCAVSKGDPSGVGDTSPSGLAVKTDGKNRYMGAAVMKNGKMVGKMDGQRMLYVNLLMGNVDGFSYNIDNISAQLAVPKKPKIKIDARQETPSIDISMKFSSLGVPEEPDISRLEDEITQEISETISHLQTLGAEPFGFAALAASDFFTIGSWESLNWHEAFSRAKVNVNVKITPIDRT